jgi:signal transduction histidine kinase
MAVPPAHSTPDPDRPAPSASATVGFDWFGPQGPTPGDPGDPGDRATAPPVAAPPRRPARRADERIEWAPVKAFLGRFAGAIVSKRTWREHAYLVVAAPLGLSSFVVLALALYVSIVATVFLVGIALLALVVLGAREAVGAHRRLAWLLLDERVPAPRRKRPRRAGFFSWLAASLSESAGWRAMAYVVVSFPVVVVGLWATVVAWGGSLALLLYPVVWQVVDPVQTDSQGQTHHSAMQFGEFYIETWPRALAVSAAGLAGVLLIPWFVRAVTSVDRLLVRGLLGPTRLSERVVDLETTRAQAVDASAATLRRIERDLHDGAQARLVALAMHLDMAKEKLAAAGSDSEGGDADLVEARDLLDTAHRNATDAIVELRDVTRSIHPPALDRGLDPALATLVARSGVPATLRTDILARPSPAIETIAYFCVAELLTNVAKHSRARRATVDVTGGRLSLLLRVTDDGGGGAVLSPGGGLAGLAERVRTVDGTVDITSPAGGPTMVTVELPSGA